MKNKVELQQDKETQRQKKEYKRPRTVAIKIDPFSLICVSPDNSPVDDENNTGNVPGMGWGEV